MNKTTNPNELARRGKATFIRSLDGYVISEQDYKNLLGEAAHAVTRCVKLEEQRDTLLAALRLLINVNDPFYTGALSTWEATEQARAAIAAANKNN